MIITVWDINGRRVEYANVEASKVSDTHIILSITGGMKVIINIDKTIIVEEIPDGN